MQDEGKYTTRKSDHHSDEGKYGANQLKEEAEEILMSSDKEEDEKSLDSVDKLWKLALNDNDSFDENLSSKSESIEDKNDSNL